VATAVHDVVNHKAVGNDNINAELIKYGGREVCKFLFTFFTYLHRNEVHPRQWNLANVWPIHKKGDRRDWSNYRGISLLCTTFKIYETVLNTRLMHWAEEQCILTINQGGFRENRGCLEQFYVLYETLKRRNHRGDTTYACFLDFRKAFPSVDRDCLAYTLHHIGVRGRMWRILRSLYKDMKSKVLVAGGATPEYMGEVGLREGSVLSPAQFILFINGLAKEMARLGLGLQECEMWLGLLLYADDIVLLGRSRSELNQMLKVVSDFCATWRLRLNHDKCKVVVFGETKLQRARRHAQPTLCRWPCGLGFIEEKSSYQYLGIFLSHDLSWDVHHAYVVRGVWLRVNDSRRIGVRKDALPLATAINIWNSYGVPILRYGIALWGTKPFLRELDTMQRGALDPLLGIYRRGNGPLLLRELGLTSIHTEYVKECARLLRRMTSHESRDTLAFQFIGAVAMGDDFAERGATAGYPCLKALRTTAAIAGLLPQEVCAKCPQHVFKQYLDTTCAQREWDLLVGLTSTQREKRSAYVSRYIAMAMVGTTAGPMQGAAPLLDDDHPSAAILRNGRHRNELIRLRVGAGAVRDHHIELERLPGSRSRTRTPRHQRVCLHCNDASVDDVPHAFFHCTRSAFPRQVALLALAAQEAYEDWEELNETQQLSLLLLFSSPAELQLPNPDAVQAILGHWLTALLDSFITQPFRPLEN
jgi:hypothetical protein